MPTDIHPFQLALQAWPTIWLVDLLRYLVPAALVALLLALLPGRWRSGRSVQDHKPGRGQRRQEFLNSMLTVLIFSANGAVIFAGVKASTPWAAYSFAPAEAIIQAVFLTLILLVLPLHPLVIFLFLAHMIVRNVLGHAGVELLPRAWLAGWWGRWLTTTLHHDLHHAQGRHNYGLYFTWWDRIGSTEHPEYSARLQRFVESLGVAADRSGRRRAEPTGG
jgi:hypothetical protein